MTKHQDYAEYISAYKEAMCDKLRKTIQEFGEGELKSAVVVGPEELTDISNIKYIMCKTVAKTTLGNTSLLLQDSLRIFKMRLENLYPNFVTSPPEIQLQILSAYRQKRAEDMAKPNTYRVKAIAASATALTDEEKTVMKLLRLKKKEVIAMRQMKGN